MKNLFIASLLAISSQSAYGSSSDFEAYGTAHASTCEVYGGLDLQEKAELQAKAFADENCRITMGGEKGESVKVKTEVLRAYRGSCWAGTDSGIAIRVIYFCQ